MRDDEVVAGDMRESPEIHGVIEAGSAGLKPLVATGRYEKRVSCRDRLRHRLPQHEPDGARFAMALYLHAQAAVASGDMTAPVPQKTGFVRSIRQRPSPRSAEHIAVYNRPLSCASRSLS